MRRRTRPVTSSRTRRPMAPLEYTLTINRVFRSERDAGGLQVQQLGGAVEAPCSPVEQQNPEVAGEPAGDRDGLPARNGQGQLRERGTRVPAPHGRAGDTRRRTAFNDLALHSQRSLLTPVLPTGRLLALRTYGRIRNLPDAAKAAVRLGRAARPHRIAASCRRGYLPQVPCWPSAGQVCELADLDPAARGHDRAALSQRERLVEILRGHQRVATKKRAACTVAHRGPVEHRLRPAPVRHGHQHRPLLGRDPDRRLGYLNVPRPVTRCRVQKAPASGGLPVIRLVSRSG
jgi:hypothetical protein